MDYELISTIANCITSATACTAFLVAWKTYRREYATKLKIKVSNEPGCIGSREKNISDYGFSISIVNMSGRPVTIQNIIMYPESAEYLIVSMHAFPHRMETADILKTVIPIPSEKVICKLWLNASPKTKNMEKKIIRFKIESTCGTFCVKTKTCVSDLIKLRQQHPMSTKLFENEEDHAAFLEEKSYK